MANDFLVNGGKHQPPSGSPPGGNVQYVQSSFNDDDGVCRGVPVEAPLQADRVPDDVVFFSRIRISIERAQADRLIVD